MERASLIFTFQKTQKIKAVPYFTLNDCLNLIKIVKTAVDAIAKQSLAA